MRTHIQKSELEAMGVCDEYQGNIVSLFFGSRSEMTLDTLANDIGTKGFLPNGDRSKDVLWVFVNLMSRQERLKFASSIIHDCCESSPNDIVHDTLDLMALFLEGNSSEIEVASQREIVETLLHETEQGTQLYKLVDATRQLMNPMDSQKSVMRICRFVENHHPNATYKKFASLGVKILKGEI